MSCQCRGCSGACCSVFPLNTFTYQGLQERAASNTEDIELQQIAAMAIRVGADPHYPERDLFTCKNWNPATRLCMDYANRPKGLCGEYPYDSVCVWCGEGPAMKRLALPAAPALKQIEVAA